MTLEQAEREVILRSLAHFRQKKAAANALGCSIRTLDHKLEKYAADDQRRLDLRAEAQERDRAFHLRARGFVTTADSQIAALVEPTPDEEQVTNLRGGRHG